MPEASLTAFAGRPFTTRMAQDAGVDGHALTGLVAAGELRRVFRGVYAAADSADDLGTRAQAVALVAPPEHVICLRTAAWVWGVDALGMGADRELPALDLMSPAGRAGPRRHGVRGSSGPLDEGDWTEAGGIRLTTPVRTAADIARLLARPDALVGLDVMLRAGLVEREAVATLLEHFIGYRGVAQARELVAFADGRAESQMESRTRLRAHDAGFPELEPQIVVEDAHGEFVARLDLGRRTERKGLEYDGDVAHGTRAQQQHDAVRRKRVERCGWDVVVVTGGQVNSRTLAFEKAVGELLGVGWRLSRHHPNRGGWDNAGPQIGAGAA